VVLLDNLKDSELVEMPARCPICKKIDRRKNIVPVVLFLQKSSWIGSAHLFCIKQYNKNHQYKYSILEYDENDKFLGEVTPI
jgi:hypothetical protein